MFAYFHPFCSPGDEPTLPQLRTLRWQAVRVILAHMRAVGGEAMVNRLDHMLDRLGSTADGRIPEALFMSHFTSFLGVEKFRMEKHLSRLFRGFDEVGFSAAIVLDSLMYPLSR